MALNRADSFLRIIRRAERGRLKIYLGYGAGVGKTYQMLEEGHQLEKEGIDVVIGFFEPHGRIDTIRVAEGLAVVPRRQVEYRGVLLEEMNVEAVLERKPQVALVDELAHTNVPGSPNPKRYQDVQDILAAGIHVITTLNIQHLESLYDTVERAVRVKVRERLPDTIVAEADQIVNVDLTPEDLRKRLVEGKIYPKERIDAALGNFFTQHNLQTLRELTLREIAAQIDLKSRDDREDEGAIAPDQVMVCLSSRGPNSEMLLRYASRLAGRLNRNWYAVYVQTPSEEPTVIDSHTQMLLSGTLTLAKQLGAMVFVYKGEDIADTILTFAKEYRVGHIVIGSPGALPWWRRLLGGRNVVTRLLEEVRGMTIVVLDTKPPVSAPTRSTTEFDGVGTESPPEVAIPPFGTRLGELLTAERIVFWDHAIAKSEALDRLTRLVAVDSVPAKREDILAAITKRESESSTFLNEGVAFPHIRLEGMGRPVAALGIAREGLSDVATAKPLEFILLIISPESPPEIQIEILARVSRPFRDRQLLERILRARNAEEALELVGYSEPLLSSDGTT